MNGWHVYLILSGSPIKCIHGAGNMGLELEHTHGWLGLGVLSAVAMFFLYFIFLSFFFYIFEGVFPSSSKTVLLLSAFVSFSMWCWKASQEIIAK